MINGLVKRPVDRKEEGISFYFALARKYLREGLQQVIQDKIFRVKITDEEKYISALESITQKINAVSQSIAKLKLDPKIEVKPADVNLKEIHDSALSASVDNLSLAQAEHGKEVLARSGEITKQLNKVEQAVRQIKLVVPATQKVQGSVSVTNLPENYDFDRIVKRLIDVEKAIGNIKIKIPEPQKIRIPEFPKTIGVVEGKAILRALDEVGKKLDELPKSFPEISMPSSISVDNFPPQKYPMPVTNINLNPLRGYAKTRGVTVTTDPTPLPDEVLAYRRSLVVYNNSSSTLYVGGSDVSDTNGMPVPANSYSPAFDAGPKMIIYGVSASGSINVRVLELSNENIGG